MSKSAAIPSNTGPSAYSEVGGAGQRSRLDFGKVAKGTVTSASSSKVAYTVTLDDPDGFVVEDCRWGGGIIAGLLGYRINFRVPVGTRVVVLGGSPSHIIGCLPSGMANGESPRSASGIDGTDVTGKIDDHAETENWNGCDPLNDMLEGELEISNLLGAGIQFLTNLVKVQGNERARIEFHTLRDMVRVVSMQFHQMTSLGDFRITTDGGRVNLAWDGTSYEHEAWGQIKEADPKAKVSKDRVDPTSVAPDGRWRFRQYMGWLGDFIHTFVVEPEEALGAMAQKNVGKSRHYQGNDGSLLWQSVSEIAFEKVCRIPVPVRIKAEQDPSGMTAMDLQRLDATFLKLWDYGKDQKDVAMIGFQLREYARYLSNFQAFARFHQCNKDWYVPTEAESAAPSRANNEEDRKKANSRDTSYVETYATIRILPDGGELHLDGYGNVYHSGAHGIHMASTRDLTLEAASDLRLLAGQNIYIMARRSIEIVAVFGGIISKARTLWRALCEWGSVHLKSDADIENPKSQDDQPYADQDPAPVLMDAGIVIDAPQGSLAVVTKKALNLTSEEGDVTVQALQGKTFLAGKTGISATAETGVFGVQAALTVVDSKDGILMDTDIFDVSKGMTFRRRLGNRSNVLSVNDIRGNIVSGQSVYGPKVGPRPVSDGVDPGKPHINHIRLIETEANHKPSLATGDDTKPVETFRTDLHEKKSSEDDTLLKLPLKKNATWAYFVQGDYVQKDSPLYQTLSQQYLAFSNPDEALYESWNWEENQLQAAPRTKSGDKPFVGSKGQHMVHETEAPSLFVPSEVSPRDFNKQTPLKSQGIQFYFRKRS